MMEIKVLGCSGGIGGESRTTCLLVNDDILIDAGTGICDLMPTALTKIDHIFLTHSHVDHILGIPLIADAVFGLRNSPITIYALEETISHLKQHIFNWNIWPDFTVLPSTEMPIINFQAITIGQCINLSDRKITVLPANHVVAAVGCALDSGLSSLAFSGDTVSCPEFWSSVNQLPNLTHLIVETTFSNADEPLALISKHYCPRLLAKDIKQLEGNPMVHITHLNPSEEDHIMQELRTSIDGLRLRRLCRDEIIHI